LAVAIGLGAWAEVSMLFYFMRHRIGFDLRPLGLTVVFAVPGRPSRQQRPSLANRSSAA